MTSSDKIIKNKVGLLNLAEHLGNVSAACRVMGYSRDSFYRYKEMYESGGQEALRELSRSKPNHANRVPIEVEERVKSFAVEFPAYGQVRVSNELKKEGIVISPGGVRSVWVRNNLENFKKRLQALEASMAADGGLILTEAQVRALEKSKADKEAHGEIETEHPGYLLAQDTYYVGTLKGVGRIYQQTVIDTYSKNAFAKLYDRKNALTAADMLNDQVIPFYEQQEVPVLRILTDRGTEYCGKRENHEYQLYLAIEDIDHTKTKARSPQTNGICERFHKTIKDEFYAVAFRKKIYHNIEELQADLDIWMSFYNTRRTHSGKRCDGRTPIETFNAAKDLVKQKVIDKPLFGEEIFSGLAPLTKDGGKDRENSAMDQKLVEEIINDSYLTAGANGQSNT